MILDQNKAREREREGDELYRWLKSSQLPTPCTIDVEIRNRACYICVMNIVRITSIENSLLHLLLPVDESTGMQVTVYSVHMFGTVRVE